MKNPSTHYDNYLCSRLLVEKQNKLARSPYSLEIRPKIKNFKRVFLDNRTTFSKFFNV